jgi:hypothetical protein
VVPAVAVVVLNVVVAVEVVASGVAVVRQDAVVVASEQVQKQAHKQAQKQV